MGLEKPYDPCGIEERLVKALAGIYGSDLTFVSEITQKNKTPLSCPERGVFCCLSLLFSRDADPSLPVGIGVFVADDSPEGVEDVVDEYLVVYDSVG